MPSSSALGPEKASRIFPYLSIFSRKNTESGDSDNSVNIALYPDLWRKRSSRRLALGVKRAMDVAGSLTALLLLSPLFALIALAIKLERRRAPCFSARSVEGQYGKKFYEFRSSARCGRIATKEPNPSRICESIHCRTGLQ